MQSLAFLTLVESPNRVRRGKARILSGRGKQIPSGNWFAPGSNKSSGANETAEASVPANRKCGGQYPYGQFPVIQSYASVTLEIRPLLEMSKVVTGSQ